MLFLEGQRVVKNKGDARKWLMKAVLIKVMREHVKCFNR
jgi:hypothetical protein